MKTTLPPMSVQMVGIKVCGITREQDLPVLGRLGVQAIGIVFAKSPRQVLMGPARELVTAAKRLHPPPQVWGVFAGEPTDMILEYAEFLGLDAVQLHGPSYTEQDIRAFARTPVVRGVNFSGVEQTRSIEKAAAAGARYILLDAAAQGSVLGGSGRVTNWEAARQIAERFPVVLSGGLNYRNVSEAIKRVRPAMVDVSSSVEMAPGVKDPGLVERFVQAVRNTY